MASEIPLLFIGIVSSEWLCYNMVFGSIDRKLLQNQPQISHLEKWKDRILHVSIRHRCYKYELCVSTQIQRELKTTYSECSRVIRKPSPQREFEVMGDMGK